MGRAEEAKKFQESEPAKAEAIYKEIVSKSPEANDAATKEYEVALVGLGEIYRDSGRTTELAELITTSRSMLNSFAKAKTSKLVRQMIDMFSTMPNTLDIQIQVTKSCIEWAISERRSFLRQNLQTRLVGFYLQKGAYQDALTLINGLLKELKRLDDKMVLVEVQLLESRAHHAVRNMPKARASLSSARTSANSVYCPPLMQAGLDMQSGILHAEDSDYNTAYSYFIEALEGYSSLEETERAVAALKYMLLSKIMLNLTDDIQTIMKGKMAQKYAGRDLEGMKAIATAHTNRSLAEFERSLEEYKDVLKTDNFIRSKFNTLYENLLSSNLLRVIEPFSRVELQHVAKLVGLSVIQVEGKLSQMILDKVFSGVLDQGTGCLIVFEKTERDKSYDAALATIKKLSDVVEVLYTNQASLLD